MTEENKVQISKIISKIETGHHHMTEFIALKPKMYSFKSTPSEVPQNTLKSIPSYRRKELTFEQYCNVLQKGDLVSTTTTRPPVCKSAYDYVTAKKISPPVLLRRQAVLRK